MVNYFKMPSLVNPGKWDTGHVQGIALDSEHKYIYYSFTTTLVKTDLDGNLIGTVEGLLGHLGCIAFNDEDRRLYGSLEYKHDSIGRGILKRTGGEVAGEDAFYIAIFDVDKINRVGMNAEKDDVMTAVYLEEVATDYSFGKDTVAPHKYCCSGIDGTSFGPVFGQSANSPKMLMVAYGIYGSLQRCDNDNQLIMQFDWRKFKDFEQPLLQEAPHHSGPRSDVRYFLFTGNTTWGIQNLEYDPFTGDWLVSVYVGKKPQFPNHPMYVIDGSIAPVDTELVGLCGERGLTLSLKREGIYHENSGVWGVDMKKGQTGMYSFGNGYYYFSHEEKTPEKLQTCNMYLYKRIENKLCPFEMVE